ncbi:unnamed protein product [Thelazia callipaeda]|uniref:G domain-containing protein n=1 Tax=Thelazia callipaeda TaxID=103827 RepID=A0A0N5CVS8_THECL|nr:unnamed protein product [Thelazia callipaeda]
MPRASQVGKSTIVKTLIGEHNFTTKEYIMMTQKKETIHFQVERKTNFSIETQNIELHDKIFMFSERMIDTVLVDTPGHEFFEWMLESVCDKNALYALCFDFTDKDSMLIGYKSDIKLRQTISLPEANNFAATNNLILHVIPTCSLHEDDNMNQ